MKKTLGAHQLTIDLEAFRLFSLSVVFRSINMSLRGYYQSMKMHRCSLVFTFLQTFGCEVLMLFLLNALIGIRGVWLSYVAGEFLSILIMAVAMRLKTGEPRLLDALMCMPASCRTRENHGMDATCHSMEDVVACSRAVETFCVEEGASNRISAILSLAVEEIAGNTVRYGFADGRQHSIDIRVKKNDSDWVLRFHDDCSGFDPTKYLQEPNEPGCHNGIRMIRRLATEVSYISALELNHLLIRIRPAAGSLSAD